MDKITKNLILLNSQNIGFIKLQELLVQFKAPEAIDTSHIDFDIDKELSLCDKHKVSVISIFDESYPSMLRQTYSPPIILYIKGGIKKQDELSVGIVGSRLCTHYGIKTAARFAEGLSAYGVTVVSGLARGIDTAAHNGAVKAGGRTIAVLGNGLSSIYPAENKKLAEAIIENGAVISEFPMEVAPIKTNFPRRNRVISGLSKGVVVVEAAEKSGALITADFALEEGREVFAVPGAAGSTASSGTNNLIKEGARLIESADELLDGLGLTVKNKRSAGEKELSFQFADDLERDIYQKLSDEPRDIDAIAEEFSASPKKVKLSLFNLEMKGAVKQLPGRLYIRV